MLRSAVRSDPFFASCGGQLLVLRLGFRLFHGFDRFNNRPQQLTFLLDGAVETADGAEDVTGVKRRDSLRQFTLSALGFGGMDDNPNGNAVFHSDHLTHYGMARGIPAMTGRGGPAVYAVNQVTVRVEIRARSVRVGGAGRTRSRKGECPCGE